MRPPNPLKRPRKWAICHRRSRWQLIVLVRSLTSALLDVAWLVESVTYLTWIGWIAVRGREDLRSKYDFSSHPKTLELTAWSVSLYCHQSSTTTNNVCFKYCVTKQCFGIRWVRKKVNVREKCRPVSNIILKKWVDYITKIFQCLVLTAVVTYKYHSD